MMALGDFSSKPSSGCTFAVLAHRFDAALSPLGLTSGQFSPDDVPELTAALKPLDRLGLVKLMADPDDRRRRL
jgi:hypothetical protein